MFVPTPVTLYGSGYKWLREVSQAVFLILLGNNFHTIYPHTVMMKKGITDTLPCWKKGETFDYEMLKTPGTTASQETKGHYQEQILKQSASIGRAKALCAECPIQLECLAYSMNIDAPRSPVTKKNPLGLSFDKYLVYGGYSPYARKKIFEQILAYTLEFKKTGKTWFLSAKPEDIPIMAQLDKRLIDEYVRD